MENKENAIDWCRRNIKGKYGQELKFIETPEGIDVYDDSGFRSAVLTNMSELEVLPVKLHEVFASFSANCAATDTHMRSKLSSLRNMPKIVHGFFDIANNKHLKSLKGGPTVVEGYYACQNCAIETMDGVAKTINGKVYAYPNPLKDITGICEANGCASCDFTQMDEQDQLQDTSSYKKLDELHKIEKPVYADLPPY